MLSENASKKFIMTFILLTKETRVYQNDLPTRMYNKRKKQIGIIVPNKLILYICFFT